MRRLRKADLDDATVDMTPMLDIVFIMLIFFIVSAVFLNETGLSLEEAPKTNAPPTTEPAILVQLDNRDVAFVEGEPVRLALVSARIETLRAKRPMAPLSLNAQAETSVKALVFLKDEFDAAQIPVSITVDR